MQSLGHPLGSLWIIESKDHQGIITPMVFDAKQAQEIARRIIEFYGIEPCQQQKAI